MSNTKLIRNLKKNDVIIFKEHLVKYSYPIPETLGDRKNFRERKRDLVRLEHRPTLT
mgnify:CR=1 FL=1